ncbi:MAG: histone deacetylase [Bryobacterales bacterium]|nr:histone deacetylase [Bryobacterales bacterium]
MLPFRFVYHSRYDLNLGDHVFAAAKYEMMRERLLEEGFASLDDFAAPEPATDDDMILVHDEGWVKRLSTGTLGYFEILKLEIPYSRKMVEGVWHATGGSMLAARLAMRDRIGFNIGGGFHHAFAGHGEGFCAINDIAVAVRRVQRDGLAARAMVVDCDVHHGNGTAAIFAGDPSVFTFSIHQRDNYPHEKPPSDLDIHLEDGVGDKEYLERLEEGLVSSLDAFQPDIVVYVAGADPYQLDQLGGLRLTMEGLRRRDRLVFDHALARGAAVCVVLAGGYAFEVRDTVAIHVNTAHAARQAIEALAL